MLGGTRCQHAALRCPVDIGVRLMQARRNAGFTLRELAALLGVAHSTLGHWENNRSVPNARHLLKIAELTGVDAYVLLTGKPSKLNQSEHESLPLPMGKRLA
ncbi:helix-turn-helix domain-containing protein [Xanthomonas cerealis pv. cerealis]|nr:helix-turn-helix domain-containing protein [Xanthomonas translucens pv. pistacia]